jgi:hypothetical protein
MGKSTGTRGVGKGEVGSEEKPQGQKMKGVGKVGKMGETGETQEQWIGKRKSMEVQEEQAGIIPPYPGSSAFWLLYSGFCLMPSAFAFCLLNLDNEQSF